MGVAVGASKGVKNDINITPLVDVVLVLLIIFMVVTPMLQRGKDVHLPPAHINSDDKKQADPLVLSLTTDHKIWVEANELGEDSIEAKVTSELMSDPNKRVLLKGDQTLTVGDVRKLMDHAKKAGAKSVELAVEEIKKK